MLPRSCGDETPAGAAGRWRFRLALSAVVGLWLALRVVYFTGYYAEDAPGYVGDAIQCVLGTYRARDHVLGLNVATYVPVALPLAVFGKTDWAVALWPLACSLLGLLSLAAAAGVQFGRWFGLLAALLYAVYPGDVFFSTVVMPDAIQAGWLAFSLALVVVAPRVPAPRRPWTLAAAGSAMGVCLLVRANGVLLLPIGVVAVVATAGAAVPRASAARSLAGYLAGWVVVPFLEGVAYLLAVGDFLHRARVVDRHYGTADSIARWGLNTDAMTIPFSIFPPAFWWHVGAWVPFNEEQAYHGFAFCLALAAAGAAGLAWMTARGRIPRATVAGFATGLFWCAWPLLWHQFGSQSATHYVPIHRLSRHLVVYGPGAAFLAVAACALVVKAAEGWRAARAQPLAAGLALAVLAFHLVSSWQADAVSHAAFHRVEDTYARIRRHLPAGVRTIVADPGDLCFFDFWLNPLGEERVRLTPFAAYARCEEIPGGVVLTRSNRGWEGLSAPVIRDTVRRLPCLVSPPPGWRLLYEGSPERVYVVTP